MTRLVLGRKRGVDTFYDVLGVSPVADYEEIHAAYRALALRHHPDRGGDAEKFKAVSQAWGTLKDEVQRRVYNLRLMMEGRLDCTGCQGTGRRSAVFSKLKHKPCNKCNGRGHL